MFRILIPFVILTILFYACQSDTASQEANTPTAPATTTSVPRFDRDSAMAYAQRQVDFGPRVPNSEGHSSCRAWLVEKLKSFGATVIEQKFTAEAYTGELLNGVNIVAQFNPKLGERVLLAAHWDTRHIADSPISEERQGMPIDGADDGASGVAVLLEVARQIQANPINLGVDIILFDAEDHGVSGEDAETQTDPNQSSWCLGSQHWARQPHRPSYKAKYGILLDMVGARGARFPREYHSVQFAPQLVDKVWTLAERMGYGNYFHNVNGGGVTDDHYFVNRLANIPMIDIINLPLNSNNKGFGAHWHTHDDNMDVLDKRTLRAAGQVVLAVIYREASGSL